MKKTFPAFVAVACMFFNTFSLYSQEEEAAVIPLDEQNEYNEKTDEDAKSSTIEESEETSKDETPVKIPAKKRPKAVSSEKLEASAKKDESAEDSEKKANTLRYGIGSEITELIDKLIKEEDYRFSDEIYDLFYISKSNSVKQSALNYFKKLEDPCLEDYAVTILIDPYDAKFELVKACFEYVSAVKCMEAVKPVIHLLDDDKYFNDALLALGDIGGSDQAVVLTEYLDRDDLTTVQRQSLMRTLGKMHAVETWDKLVEILDDEDENAFVRMYAAEALGLMGLDKSVPVLSRHFEENDNLRQYVIRGLKNFEKSEEARAIILEGVRDEHWKVRQESILAVQAMLIKDAVPYLIYRAKNDSEKLIKDESYKTLAMLHTKEADDFLIAQITEKKVPDSARQKAAEVLLKNGNAGENEIIELAKTTITDDKRKPLRYALGKEIAKYDRSSFSEICTMYLQSSDTQTISLGLDMYKTGRYSAATEIVKTIASDKKANTSNRARAKNMLGIEDEVKIYFSSE